MEPLNLYGDKTLKVEGGFGVDIAAQRLDELDNFALDYGAKIISGTGRLNVLELGSGPNGLCKHFQALGGSVTAIDVVDYSSNLAGVKFITGNAFELDYPILGDDPYDVVVSQRMFHYLDHKAALITLRKLREAMNSGGRMFVSVSGLFSELGNDYEGQFIPLQERFAPLSQAMQAKHHIKGPVCLYSPDELSKTLKSAGFMTVDVYSSQFGNVKARAW